MRSSASFGALAMAAGLVAAAPDAARADDNDIRLNSRFSDIIKVSDAAGEFNPGDPQNAGRLQTCINLAAPCTFAPQDERFRALATELGFVLAPHLMTPAETLGHSGFELGVGWAASFVKSSEAYWKATESGSRGGAAPSTLSTLEVHARKGLPFSFEFGAFVNWLVSSRMFAPGIEVRWAVQEGWAYIPDLAIRGATTRLIGSDHLDLTTVQLDAALSKAFSLSGAASLTPYFGAGFVMINAASAIVDPTPENEDRDLQNSLTFKTVRATDNVKPKIYLGGRVLSSVVALYLQAELGFAGSTTVTTIGTKLALDY